MKLRKIMVPKNLTLKKKTLLFTSLALTVLCSLHQPGNGHPKIASEEVINASLLNPLQGS